ncbi:MAG: M23 family metallopeptidase [Methylococcaceae bacterium]|nr:M23 family metallopeptidase [Methylococcaceae bacterium]
MGRSILLTAFVLLICGRSFAADEPAPRFALPLACTPGDDCFLQNYVDRDAGPGAADYACGFLTYDGHRGSDFRLVDRAAMLRGVVVKAAAGGVVRAVRDGMADRSIAETGSAAVAGREAGNSVVIVHGNGWETQYAHMQLGSIAVKAGQSVKTGDILGKVGLSGKTEFPHLHFEVRHDEMSIDPFTSGKPLRCGEGGGASLWDPNSEKLLSYRPASVLKAGFSFAVPELESILDAETPAKIDPQADALIFWVYLIGIREGDTETTRLYCDGDKEVVSETKTLAKNKAIWLTYTGVRHPRPKCPGGSGFRAEYRLVRQVPAGYAKEIVAIDRRLAP